MSLTVGEALEWLRDRWWVLVVSALAAALVAYAYTKLPWVEPRWRSTISVQVTGRFDYGNSLALARELAPLAEQVRQLKVMREVNRNLHLDLPPEKMLDLTKAEPVQDTNQIRIDYDDADPTRAEQVALEIASVYTDQNNASQAAALREERVLMSVLDRPNTAVLIWPQTKVIVPAAALLGLFAAAGIVLLLAYLDDTLKTPADVERYLGLPLIGRVPAYRLARSGRAASAVPARGIPTPVSAGR